MIANFNHILNVPIRVVEAYVKKLSRVAPDLFRACVGDKLLLAFKRNLLKERSVYSLEVEVTLFKASTYSSNRGLPLLVTNLEFLSR